MNELKQVNPYETPQSPSSRRGFHFLIYGSIIAVILFVGSAGALMIGSSVKKMPDKRDHRVFMDRGPVRHHEVESAPQEK